MENKDLKIYNAVANVAARVFASFDAGMFQPGKYDVPAVLNRMKQITVFQDEDAETAASEIVKIEIGTFTCSFRAVDSFRLLKRFAAAFQIPTACRAQFVKKADAAPVAVSFRVFAGLKDLCTRTAKKDILRPCFNYICVDTKRRALIVCDNYTLSAVPVPEMYVSPDAKETYLITPAVLKAGHGVCNIDTNGTATNGAAVSSLDEDIKFPNISRVLFAVPAEFITLGKKVFADLKKNVSAAAKFAKIDNTPVILKADAGANEIEIIGYKESETETNTPREIRRAVVSLPQPVPFAFAVAVDPERLGKVLAAEKMYLKDPFAPVCFVDETRRVFSVMYPGKDLNKTPFFNSSFEIPVPAGALSVDAVAGTFAPVQDAPAAPFTDEETAPAVPAVSDDTKITYITKNYVPVITEEIRDAVAVAAKYKYIPYYYNEYGVRCSRERTATVYGAELLLQRENLYIDNYALICGNGQTFAYITVKDEDIKINYDVAQDEETANVETPAADSVPAVQDAPAVQNEETPAVAVSVAADNETPAVADSVPAAAVQNAPETANAAPADSVPAVSDDDDQETAASVQDETPAADSVPAVFAKVDEYAVNDESGNAVIFETYAPQLGTDEETANVETPAADSVPAAAVQNETPAVADSLANDEETPAVPFAVPDDEETPAVAVSVAADNETPANVQNETPAVPFAVPDDEETPAVADSANSRRRFRVWPWLIRAAAVLIAFILFAVNDAEKTPAVADSVPAVAVPAVQNAPDVPAVADILAAVLFAVPDDAQETNDAPAVAVSVPADNETPAVADKQPQTAKKQPQTRRKRARRADRCKQFVPDVPAAVSVADSLAADSLAADSVPAVLFAVADSLAADSLANVPAVVSVADSVPADSVPVSVADSLANVPAVDAPAVQDEETDAPAVVSVPDDEETPAVADSVPAVPEDAPDAPAADSVPADSVPNSPAPAVPAAAPGTPAPAVFGTITAAPVWIPTL